MASKTPNPAATSTPTSSIPNDKTQLLPLISQLEKHRNTRVIVYWLLDTARISEAALVSLYDQVPELVNNLLYLSYSQEAAKTKFLGDRHPDAGILR